MDNQRIAQVFEEIGAILEISDANRFRVLAYQKAAQIISDLGRDVGDIYQAEGEKGLMDIPGIGKDLALKIQELLEKGKCEYHQELLKKFDHGLLDMLKVRGVGPKKVKLFYTNLGINSIEKLKKAAEEGQLRDLPKMGEKSEAEILIALKDYDRHIERANLQVAFTQANEIIKYMEKCKGVEKVTYAGSLRRMKETVGDLDILVAGKNIETIMDYAVKFPEITKVLAKGDTKTSFLLASGLQVDVRVIAKEVFGAALHYFTGSKEHNVVLRDRAKKMGLKVNEYGVYKLVEKKGEVVEELVVSETEEQVYKAMGLPYIAPELRENRGELEAALHGELPKLLEVSDLKGDLHVHSHWSDGTQEIGEIVRLYRDRGFEYIALTDHSPAVAVAHGLNADRFELQWAEIDEIQKELDAEAKKGAPHFKILKGVECDILADGRMDLPDDVLKHMDIVVASVHSRFRLSVEEQTARVIKAFKNPYVKIFGHPSGRLINQREPISLDYEKIFRAAIAEKVALEINSQPTRLDLADNYCKLAKSMGAMFTVDSDAHHIQQVENLMFGVSVARRGWVEKDDVLNTRGLKDFLGWWK